MSAIPPNNLEQLIAWIRIFAEDVSRKIHDLQEALTSLHSQSKEDK